MAKYPAEATTATTTAVNFAQSKSERERAREWKATPRPRAVDVRAAPGGAVEISLGI